MTHRLTAWILSLVLIFGLGSVGFVQSAFGHALNPIIEISPDINYGQLSCEPRGQIIDLKCEYD